MGKYTKEEDQMSTFSWVAANLYDANTRPELVAQGLARCGTQRLLDEKSLAVVASMTTIAGFREHSAVLQEMAAPYIKKACDKDGRKELAEMASEKVIKPTKEFATPYVAKLKAKRAELAASKRYEQAVSALQAVREHPVETAMELRAKAIDLLQYEKFATYREYVQSEEFQADTRRLVQVELPTIALDAASRGLEKMKQGATFLATEIEATRSTIYECGYVMAQKIESKDFRSRSKALLAELQSQLNDGAQQFRTEGFSLTDAMMRFKRVAAAIDSVFISPGRVSSEEALEPAATLEDVLIPHLETSLHKESKMISRDEDAGDTDIELENELETDIDGDGESPKGSSTMTIDALGPI